MTTAAWIMLAVTWSVVVSITGRLFWKVLTSPRPQDLDDTSDGILRKDA
jgi:hypothetical protein